MSESALAGYYRWHARIYDWTRPFFLFGRRDLVHRAYALLKPRRVLEIGCGTGWLLGEFARLDETVELTGIDLSADMLARARKRLGTRASLINGRYQQPLSEGGYDLIVMSYVLTMTGDNCKSILATARRDLSPNGAIAIVDFDRTEVPWFARWMRVNHVEMSGQIKREIDQRYQPLWLQQRRCYFGLWQRLSALLR